MRGTIHRALMTASEHFRLEVFQEHNLDAQIRTSLEVTGRMHRRNCPLKAPLVVAFVLGLALHRGFSVVVLQRRFLDFLDPDLGEGKIDELTSEAWIKARGRLGVEPLRHLFGQVAVGIKPHETFHGKRLLGIDGVVETMPDTPANALAFGRTGSHRGRSAWPQLRAVPLVELTTRQVVDVVFTPCSQGERSAVRLLLSKLGDMDVTLLDRGFSAAWVFHLFQQQETHFVARIGKTWKPHVLERLPDGSQIVEVTGRTQRPGDETRKGPPRGPKITLRLRLVEYSVGKRERIRLLTDLMDPVEFPAIEMARLYHRRWECELAYDEQKTHLAGTPKGAAATTYRSKTPDGVIQEAYALMIVYNLVRRSMAEAASEAGISPLVLSFLEVLDRIRVWLPRLQEAKPARLPALRARFLQDLARCRNRRPRRQRVYPRVVKRKMSNFGLKRRHHRGQIIDLKAQVRVRTRNQPERKAA